MLPDPAVSAPAANPHPALPPPGRRRGPTGAPQVALIDAARCVGCTLCIAACPVEAIVGAPKRRHDVLAELCSGCELCLPPCPVDCIAMEPAGCDWSADDIEAARARYDARVARRSRAKPHSAVIVDAAGKRAAAIAAALARARMRRTKTGTR